MGKHWIVTATASNGLQYSHSVPFHRLSETAAKNLVRTLVLRFENLTFEEFVNAHINRRKGGPIQLGVEDANYFADPSAARAGYRLDGPTVSAEAWWPLSADTCEFLKREMGRH